MVTILALKLAASSSLFSLIETCKQHSINVFSWLKYVLTSIHQAKTLEQLKGLLPYNINTNLLENMRNIPELIFPDKGVIN
jgi:transposase